MRSGSEAKKAEGAATVTSAAITIDAGVLAVPSLTACAEEARDYVDRILELRKLLDDPWIMLCMSENAYEALYGDGLFPMRPHLSALFSHHKVREYDVNTVAPVIDRLLKKTPSFETYYRVRDISPDEFSAAPDIVQFCAGDALKDNLTRCILLMAILRKHSKGSIPQSVLMLNRCPKHTIHLRALVSGIKHDRDDLTGIPVPPVYFHGDVLACNDFRGFLACIDDAAVLVSAADATGVEVAVRIHLYNSRLARGEDPNWDDIGGMTIGGHFHDAIRQCCKDADGGFPNRALRAICETVDKQSMRSVHSLRTGPGGNDPQRRRASDKANAWRRDIDREYHLHYWELPNGSVELATVGVHDDFDIPE